MLDATDFIVSANEAPCSLEVVADHWEKGFLQERALARSRNSGDAAEDAERNLHIDILEVVLASSADEKRLPVRLAALCGHGDPPLPGEELARHRVWIRPDLFGRADGDHPAAMLAGARPDIDHPIGALDRLLVVLHHDDRVAQVAQLHEGVDQPAIIPLMEADGGLIQNVEDAHQPGADLSGEPDALRLAAGQRRRRTVEGEVADANVGQEAQARSDLFEDTVGDMMLALG